MGRRWEHRISSSWFCIANARINDLYTRDREVTDMTNNGAKFHGPVHDLARSNLQCTYRFVKDATHVTVVHYWKTVLCRVPDTLPSAKYRGTRQRNILPSVALGKILHSAKSGTRQICTLPSAWTIRHSAKFIFIFLKKTLPSAILGHSAIFFYFLKTNFAECLLGPALGKDTFAECSPWHSAKYIYIFLFWTQIFLCSLVTVFKALL